MKRFKYRYLIIIFIVLVLGILLFLKFFYPSLRKSLINSEDFLYKHVNIVLDEDLGDNVYKVSKDEDVSVFSSVYQKVISKKIDALISKGNFTFDNPLIIYNPYGTNNSGVNVYFKDDGEDYSYEVSAKGYSKFSRDLKDSSEKIKEYQLIGLVAGCNNKVTIKSSSKKYSFKIKIPSTSSIDVKLKSTKSSNEDSLENGLYAILGHDKNFNSNIYLYDNDGVLRSELALKSYRTDRIIFSDDYMIYSYKKNGFIKVDRTGKIVSFYNISGYTLHHDFVLDGDKLVILANKDGDDTIEDRVISLDLKSGKVSELINMKNYLSEYYKSAVKPEGGNTYGGDELDWIHLNSLQVSNNSIYLSSRELSMIIKMDDIYSKPKLDYIIADDSIILDSYKKYSYKKVGDFVSQAGQHSITYTPLDDSKYYLTIYNNNFGNMRTRPSFEWSNFKNVGTYSSGDYSYVYKYLVDEDNHTYELVSSFKVPYSSIVSNMQYCGDNVVTSSGKNHSFAEYDSDGVLIKEFDYTSKKYAYRVFKYNFDLWFR